MWSRKPVHRLKSMGVIQRLANGRTRRRRLTTGVCWGQTKKRKPEMLRRIRYRAAMAVLDTLASSSGSTLRAFMRWLLTMTLLDRTTSFNRRTQPLSIGDTRETNNEPQCKGISLLDCGAVSGSDLGAIGGCSQRRYSDASR